MERGDPVTPRPPAPARGPPKHARATHHSAARGGWREQVAAKCAEVAPNKHNNLGYLLIDFPAYDIAKAQRAFGNDWVSALRCSPTHAPGYQQYLRFLLK